ncbi:MAG: prepilin-type N-terminal cleavage/methylation domain-containing protein [Deltaproteobacteria bacterium]|jgi:prepilin-type N-terminal cleavage/methylation domain-containing protein|nr:prepilin-type N-terminal cleavage/methylation domain-containing protein [Deltaproteobacteria bacterium]
MENKLKKNPILTRGFTLVELIVVITVIGIMLATSLPSFMQWREGLRYREASNGFVAALRAARSASITTNRQVEIEVVGNTYRTKTGNRSIASTVWVDQPLVTLSAGIGFNSPNSRIIANPNGSLFFTSVAEGTAVFFSAATNITVAVQNASAAPVYNINLTQTGRIRTTRVN